MVPLIDTHQHLIYPDRLLYPWTDGAPALAGRRFGLEEYQALTDGLGVAGAIFMEVDAADPVREAEIISALAREPGSGVLGLVASCRPEIAEGFEAWLDRGPELGVLGYRRILHEAPDALSEGAVFRANLRRIGARGLPFDMVVQARQLPLARALAQACPDVTLVLDHCGAPEIAAGGLDPWRAEILALAAEPNVVAKISGVFAYCAPGDATLAAVRPYVEHVILAFGAERCLWGGDWPVVNVRGGDLPGWIAATRVILAELSPDEATAIASGTAGRVYGVSLSGAGGRAAGGAG